MSGAWMAYFLRGCMFPTSHYLMLEYWAISVFLIGMTFFVMKRHVWAAAAVGVATLIRLSFAPFMLFASLYYLAASTKEWAPRVHYVLTGKRQDPWRRVVRTAKTQNMKAAYAWVVATGLAGLLYLVNDMVGRPLGRPLAYYVPEVGLSAFMSSPLQFEPRVLWMLFNESYFPTPPIPIVAVIALALIGIAFLSKDQSIVLCASLAMLPLIIATNLVSLIVPGLTLVTWSQWANIPSRWIAMSITMVNLFWLTGAYKICARVYYTMNRRIGFAILARLKKRAAILN
jgi:hypothetical protein